jgi:hypothetical protein
MLHRPTRRLEPLGGVPILSSVSPFPPFQPDSLDYSAGCFPFVPDVQAIEVLLWRNGFPAAC